MSLSFTRIDSKSFSEPITAITREPGGYVVVGSSTHLSLYTLSDSGEFTFVSELSVSDQPMSIASNAAGIIHVATANGKLNAYSITGTPAVLTYKDTAATGYLPMLSKVCANATHIFTTGTVVISQVMYRVITAFTFNGSAYTAAGYIIEPDQNRYSFTDIIMHGQYIICGVDGFYITTGSLKAYSYNSANYGNWFTPLATSYNPPVGTVSTLVDCVRSNGTYLFSIGYQTLWARTFNGVAFSDVTNKVVTVAPGNNGVACDSTYVYVGANGSNPSSPTSVWALENGTFVLKGTSPFSSEESALLKTGEFLLTSGPIFPRNPSSTKAITSYRVVTTVEVPVSKAQCSTVQNDPLIVNANRVPIDVMDVTTDASEVDTNTFIVPRTPTGLSRITVPSVKVRTA